MPMSSYQDVPASPVEESRWDNTRGSLHSSNHPINTQDSLSSYSQGQMQCNATRVCVTPTPFLFDPIHHRSQSVAPRRNADFTNHQPVNSPQRLPTPFSRTLERHHLDQSGMSLSNRISQETRNHGSRNADPGFGARDASSIHVPSILQSAGSTPATYTLSQQPQLYRPHENQGWPDGCHNNLRSPILPRNAPSSDEPHSSLDLPSHHYAWLQQRTLFSLFTNIASDIHW
jgi:hypothetical protein